MGSGSGRAPHARHSPCDGSPATRDLRGAGAGSLAGTAPREAAPGAGGWKAALVAFEPEMFGQRSEADRTDGRTDGRDGGRVMGRGRGGKDVRKETLKRKVKKINDKE